MTGPGVRVRPSQGWTVSSRTYIAWPPRHSRSFAPRRDDAILERLLRSAAEDPHPNIRGFAARALADFEDERDVVGGRDVLCFPQGL